MRKWIALAGLCIAVISGCIRYTCNGRNFDHRAQKQVQISAVAAPDRLIYGDLTHTDITVIGGDTDVCALIADLSVNATSQEIADAIAEQADVKLVQEADRLVIAIQKPAIYEEDYSISARMQLTVPADMRLDLHTTHGDCQVEKILRAVDVQTTHGTVQFDGVGGDINAVSTHGGIVVTHSKNHAIRAATTHSKIELNDCTAKTIQCTTTHASIRLDACLAEEAVLKSTHGEISGELWGIGRLDAQTSHAGIRLRCCNPDDPDMTAMLKTTHAPIEFTPPAGFAGTVTAATSHGHIQTDLPLLVQGIVGEDKLQGAIGQGSGSITLTTSHNTVRLKSSE